MTTRKRTGTLIARGDGIGGTRGLGRRDASAGAGFGGCLGGDSGFTLLFVLLFVVVMGILSAAAARTYSLETRREMEAELLFRGTQYREAIGRYMRFQGKNQFPMNLEDLLKDPRSAATVRHIRRLFKDPVTGDDFELMRAAQGWIVGVRSRSENKPIKQGGFPAGLESFAGKMKYKEWEFVYRPVRPESTH